MSTGTIRNLFQTAVSTITTNTGVRVAFENQQFTPEQGETYIVCNILPSLTKSKTLSGDHTMFKGIYQLTVAVNSGVGTGRSDRVIKEIQEIFRNNKVFTNSDGFSVQVISPLHVPEGRIQNGLHITACHFEYVSHTN